jgi:hypothetical protein
MEDVTMELKDLLDLARRARLSAERAIAEEAFWLEQAALRRGGRMEQRRADTE